MRYLLLLLPLALLGCADSSTTGSIREYDITVNIHDNRGPVNLEFPLSVDATSSTDQITENASDIAPDLRLQLTEGGSTSALSGADSVLDGITSTLSAQLKEKAVEEAAKDLGVEMPVKAEEPAEAPTATDDIQTESGTYHGRHNGDRPTWYFAKDFAQYPTPLMVDIPGCVENKLIEHDGVRYDTDGLILKQSDVAGRHMAIVAPSSCQSETATIAY
jgi:hypothetical protein